MELPGEGGLGLQVQRIESLKRAAEHAVLQRNDQVVPNARALPGFDQSLSIWSRQGLDSSAFGEAGDLGKVDEQRVEPKGTAGGIGTGVDRQSGEEGEQHQDPLPRRIHPGEAVLHRSEITYSKIRRRTKRKERKQYAGGPAKRWHIANLHQPFRPGNADRFARRARRSLCSRPRCLCLLLSTTDRRSWSLASC